MAAAIPFTVSPPVMASSPLTKNMTFYMHYTSNPPQVGGVVTNYVFDTSSSFQTVKNSDYKGTGQPKIALDWYLAPSLAGPVGLNGVWQTIIFANSTALHPSTWGIEFWEKSSSGAVVWDSGSLAPTVLGGPSGNNAYVDSPVFGYTLKVNLNHSFAAGNTLQMEVTVNTGATVALRVWYDSPYYPSRLILPSDGYARVAGLITQDVNGTARTTFFPFWSQSQRKAVVVASITDPFGGYDIAKALVQIKGPGGFLAVDNASMALYSGTSTSYASVFRYTYSYNSSQPKGTYSVLAAVVDNNGQIQFGKTGSYSPFIESATTEFSIGVQFPVTVRVLDSHNTPLASAFVQFTQGGLNYVSGRTSPDGMLNLTLFTGTFVALVTWEGVVVARQAVNVANQTTFTIVTSVYNPTFILRTSSGIPVSGILVFVTYPNQTTGRLPLLTNDAGAFTLSQQPKGNFSLLAFFEGVNVADTSVSVISDGPFAVTTLVHKVTVGVNYRNGLPLSQSSVLVKGTGPSNLRVYAAGETGANGSVSFVLPAGNYTIQLVWSSVNVGSFPLSVNSDRAFQLNAQVYQLVINVTDSSHGALVNSSVALKGTDGFDGLVYRFGKTSADGTVSFDLPRGEYQATAEYHNVYWLSFASNTTSSTLALSSDRVLQMSMKNIPPPIWATLGFAIIAFTVVIIVSTSAVYLWKRRRPVVP